MTTGLTKSYPEQPKKKQNTVTGSVSKAKTSAPSQNKRGTIKSKSALFSGGTGLMVRWPTRSEPCRNSSTSTYVSPHLLSPSLVIHLFGQYSTLRKYYPRHPKERQPKRHLNAARVHRLLNRSLHSHHPNPNSTSSRKKRAATRQIAWKKRMTMPVFQAWLKPIFRS